MHSFFGAVASLLFGLMVGCTDSPSVLDDSGVSDSAVDGSDPDSGVPLDGDVPDGDVPDTGTPPTDSGTPPDDGGMTGCPAGEHMCSTGCERDRTNEPAEGCRNGCALECTGTDPICSSDGFCTIACEAPAVIVGAVCCGGTPVCSSMVAARCPVPTEEPNETRATAHDLGNFIDNDSMASITNLTLLDGDEDWYTFTATDSPSLGRTEFFIDITAIADPGTMEIAMWFECADPDTVTTSHVCTAGTANTEFGDGCSAPIGDSGGAVAMDIDCEGTTFSPVTDESGTVHVRVKRTPAATACDGYDLHIAVHEEF